MRDGFGIEFDFIILDAFSFFIRVLLDGWMAFLFRLLLCVERYPGC
jgi:hypothetical protein